MHCEKADIIFECASASEETRVILQILKQIFRARDVAPKAVDQSINFEKLTITSFCFSDPIGEKENAIVRRQLHWGGLILCIG
jgi:hypothetical protein